MKSALNKLCWVQDMAGHGWAGMDVKYIFIFRAAATCLEVDPSPMPAVGRLQDQAKNSLAASGQSFLFPSVWAGIPHGVAAGEGRREERGDQVKTLRHLGCRAWQGGGGRHQGCVAHVCEPGTVLGIFRGDPTSEVSRSPLGSNRAAHYALIYCRSQVFSFPVLWVGLCHRARALTSGFLHLNLFYFGFFFPSNITALPLVYKYSI